ncbi:phage tail protein [Govanella unica]|uniref:Phage tail protein n=1 Tax=Govanella unica TaxID=2975056 RepID=A0A9X3U074_9PROT|nr:phage tail protein [Govania unica]MDA5194950.1 phage tail protein [Govania unica]
MAAEKGRAFILKIGDGAMPELFTTIGGMRATSLSINNELVDVTNKSSGGWREILGGAGTRAIAVTGSGVFTNSAAEKIFQGKVMTAAVSNYEIAFESGDSFRGAFFAANLDFSGDHNGERTYSLRLDSAGVVSFTGA